MCLLLILILRLNNAKGGTKILENVLTYVIYGWPLSNIPFQMNEEAIKNFFNDQVGNVSHVETFYNKEGKFRGSCLVEFFSETDTKYALGTVYILGQ